MNSFIFSIPTTAHFGKGQISILGETIKAHGGSKVLLAYGGSIKQNGIYDTILEQFSKAGLAFVELSGIQPKLWIVPIPGTTNPAHLNENLGATTVKLTADDLKEITTAAAMITVQGARLPQASMELTRREAPPKNR